ncbi:MAG: hypothetical protein E4H01_07470 [Lysobacterales bacterium]|nr:MAG: hypothetical protein E4H01_07470 [Xanthomonadales bacterium]
MARSTNAVSQEKHSGDRRTPAERRLSILSALWKSSFARRRLGPRRDKDQHPVMTDWFHPQWLATAIIILILSTVDAVLTLALISRGAIEINPLMEPLVRGSGRSFALWKLGLTSIGVVVLTMLARLRVFGRLAVGSFLYLVLGGYLLLVGYELSLLRSVPGQ